MIKPNFKALERLLPIMKAERISWKSDGITRKRAEFINNLTTTGIVVEYGDVDIKDGLLSLDGEQVVIYIKDHRAGYWKGIFGNRNSTTDPNSLDPLSLNRFHLSDCNTIEGMKNASKFDRYVATKRKDGLFEIDYRGQEIEAKLYPCRNCLRKLHYKKFGYLNDKEKQDIVYNFDIEEFFKEYETKFEEKTRYTDKTAPKNEYPDNWDDISREYRESQNWICEKCGKDFSGDRGNLHTHHINSLKHDCSLANLKALCKTCHSQEHGHMR